MKLSIKLQKSHFIKYKIICEYAYGCYPLDVKWAVSTDIFKQIESNLISIGIIDSELNID